MVSRLVVRGSSDERLGAHLARLLAEHDPAAHRARDPVSFVHASADEDREIVGLLSSSLAFGNVVAVRASIARALAALGPSPAAVVDRATKPELERRFAGFVHRVYRGEHVAALLFGAARLRAAHGTLGRALEKKVADAGDLREGLARFASALRGPDAPRGLTHLVPDPRAGSACKRLHLYLRWMVRPADGVDLGLWPELSPAGLIIPVDTHVHRIARNLGLTTRADASWRTAEEITASLRRFDPDDPVKFDFALCHLGISRQCPSRRDPDKCEACVLRPSCLVWR